MPENFASLLMKHESKSTIWDWRNGGEIKSIGFSSRGPAFNSQHPHSTIIYNSSSRGYNALFWSLPAPGAGMHEGKILVYMKQNKFKTSNK